MLILTRKPGQSILVQLDSAVFEHSQAEQDNTDASIEIVVTRVKGNQVGIGIRAHKSVNIVRTELIENCESTTESPLQP